MENLEALVMLLPNIHSISTILKDFLNTEDEAVRVVSSLLPLEHTCPHSDHYCLEESATKPVERLAPSPVNSLILNC